MLNLEKIMGSRFIHMKHYVLLMKLEETAEEVDLKMRRLGDIEHVPM